MKPMLAHSIPLAELVAYCNDPRYAASQKVDGLRLMVVTGNGVVRALGRDGEPSKSAISPAVLAAFAPLRDMPACFDGEYVDGVFHLFDLPSAGGAYAARRDALEAFMGQWSSPCVRLLPACRDAASKLKLALRLYEGHAEGVMFNRLDAPYESGRRSYGLLKAKFVKDIDCVVMALGAYGKASMSLGVYDGEILREIGECTALAGDGASIKVGDVVSVQYLYALDPAAPRIYQPTLPRLRSDKAARECVIGQIHFTDRSVKEVVA